MFEYIWVFDNTYNTKILKGIKIQNVVPLTLPTPAKNYCPDTGDRSVGNCGECKPYPDKLSDSTKCGKTPVWGKGCKSDSDCCCMNQKCKICPYYSQCVTPKNCIWPATEHGGRYMTHYWDCCRQSCTFPGNTKSPCTSCKYGINPTIYKDTVKDCCNKKHPTPVGMCYNQIPWIGEIDGQKILYGYGAVNENAKKSSCGQVYQIMFSPKWVQTAAKEIYLMVTNTGNLSNANIDFAIPGGGFGENTTGCKYLKTWDWDSTVTGAVISKNQCATVFKGNKAAITACETILFGGIFGQNGCNYNGSNGEAPNLKIDSVRLLTGKTKKEKIIISNLRKGNPEYRGNGHVYPPKNSTNI